MKRATKTERLDNIILSHSVWDCKKIATTGKWKLQSMWRHYCSVVCKIWILVIIPWLWHLFVLIAVWILKSYTEHGLESRLMVGIISSDVDFCAVSTFRDFWGYFNSVITFHFWAVLVIWQHTLSRFASYYKGVWMVSKAAGADGHERLYPWFPHQDAASVVSWSILFASIDGIWRLWPGWEGPTEAARF